MDFEVNYSTSVAGHALTLRGLATRQPHIYYFNPGAATLDLAGTSFSGSGYPPTARWRATVIASFQPVDSLTVSLTGRWRSSLGHTPDPNSIVAQPRVPSAAFANLNVSNKMKIGRADADLFLNVQNLFNKQPPTASFFGSANSPGSSTTGGFVAGDDPIGRYFTVGLRLNM
jgi:outer membrane receptor protein involved in Fe transport